MDALLEQVRELVSERTEASDVVEKRMFGGVGFMVRGKLTVWAAKDGRLIARVADERGPQLAERVGVELGVMGERSMGPGWLVVSPEALADEDALTFWVEESLAHNARVAGAG